MNHMYQIIRSDKLFTVHEYAFGVRLGHSYARPISELSRILRCIPPHSEQLQTIRTNDAGVKNNADSKHVIDQE